MAEGAGLSVGGMVVGTVVGEIATWLAVTTDVGWATTGSAVVWSVGAKDAVSLGKSDVKGICCRPKQSSTSMVMTAAAIRP